MNLVCGGGGDTGSNIMLNRHIGERGVWGEFNHGDIS